MLEVCLEEIGLDRRQVVRVEEAGLPGRGNSSNKDSKSGNSSQGHLFPVCISRPRIGHLAL